MGPSESNHLDEVETIHIQRQPRYFFNKLPVGVIKPRRFRYPRGARSCSYLAPLTLPRYQIRSSGNRWKFLLVCKLVQKWWFFFVPLTVSSGFNFPNPRCWRSSIEDSFHTFYRVLFFKDWNCITAGVSKKN